MKNIVKSLTLVLALLAPITGFAMEANTQTEQPICVICRDEILPDQDTARITHTKKNDTDKEVFHEYHDECIQSWLVMQYMCPHCNKQLPLKEQMACFKIKDLNALLLSAASIDLTKFFLPNAPLDVRLLAYRLSQLSTEDIIEKLTPEQRNHFKLLHLAVHFGDAKKVALLLNNGVDVNATNANNKTPLHLASAYCLLDIAQLLLDAGANVNAVDAHGKTPFDLAFAIPYPPMASLLLSHGATATPTQKGFVYWHRFTGKIFNNRRFLKASGTALAFAGLAYYLGT